MSPDIARRLVASLKYDVINGSQDEKAIFASQVREATSYINSQAAQIKALKDKLLLVKCEKIYWSLHGTGHPEEKSTPVQYEEEARKQLKAEMPGMDW